VSTRSFAPPRPDDGVVRGYLQLCADLRYHRATMTAFERATGLPADGYWIEARPGGAPSWSDNTRGARLAHERGATHMGWAAHGDECLGLRGESDEQIRRRLERTVRARAADFPDARHYGLFGVAGEVEVFAHGRAR
jgi:hypothetical protein